MKQLMIDMMASMMPFMRPLALLAGAVAVVGLVFGIIGRGGAIARWAGRVALAAALFFLASELAGRLLGFEPTILFAAPADRSLYRNQWPFWTVGLAFLLVWLATRALSRSR